MEDKNSKNSIDNKEEKYAKPKYTNWVLVYAIALPILLVIGFILANSAK